MKDADLERMLRQSLASAAEPEEPLNQSIIHQITERSRMRTNYKKRLFIGLFVAIFVLIAGASAYAATQLFTAKQVAEHLGDPQLAEAFESEEAIRINAAKDSGDYRFTLLGIVSGVDLSISRHSSEDVYPNRTYAVVSIARRDGQPMPDVPDPEFGKVPFFVSPLVKGLKPWQVNIASMNGGFSEDVIDGVMYRIISLDEVEIFADRGVYLAISSGSPFYSNDAFRYDEATGEIHAREDYPGASVLFDLPLDAAKADPAKADAYVEALSNPTSDSAEQEEQEEQEEDWVQWIERLRAQVRAGELIGETIAESVQEVSYDESGDIEYSYNGWNVSRPIDQLFKKDQVGYSDYFPISGDDESYKAVLFHRDDNGIITGRVVVLSRECPGLC
ncbi:hypothetical protein [Cohnella fermenti]|uniref:DUF4179 domain-containing protein n=1 Tax=Cohnella fermenti TaxID=2565925 RepID=A0A4S4C292_9BACL|nr:hypothetical protein [Cohnella fermenti]THF81629.1 hypothetical protein E6C55_07815 [Cohnella fermenti]